MALFGPSSPTSLYWVITLMFAIIVTIFDICCTFSSSTWAFLRDAEMPGILLRGNLFAAIFVMLQLAPMVPLPESNSLAIGLAVSGLLSLVPFYCLLLMATAKIYRLVRRPGLHKIDEEKNIVGVEAVGDGPWPGLLGAARTHVRQTFSPVMPSFKYNTDVEVRQNHTAFLQSLEDMQREWPFAQQFQFSEDEVVVLFFKSMSFPLWDEWRDAVAIQYSIGGMGGGPSLSLSQLVDLAEEEEQLPVHRKTTQPGSVPRWVRFVVRLFGVTLYPWTVFGVAASFYLRA